MTLNNFVENHNHQKNSCFAELEKFGQRASLKRAILVF
jgi:hypothetical protein